MSVEGVGFRVEGSGFMVWGVGFRVQGSDLPSPLRTSGADPSAAREFVIDNILVRIHFII